MFISLGMVRAYAQAGGEITPKGITFPRYTDANRPTGPLAIGTTIFNTGQNTHQYWNGSGWTNVSTPGSGGGPWSAVGNNVYNNTGSRVGINTNNPSADLEIQGGGGLLISEPYTVTASPPATTYTMPYNGTLATITDNAGRVLDPGGNGNFLTNTNYASYIRLTPTGNVDGFRFTFESLAVGGSTIIFSTSSDVANTGAYILSINQFSNYAAGRPFNIKGFEIYIHNKIISGGTAAAGFQLLFEALTVSGSPSVYTELVGGALSYSTYKSSFTSGNSRAGGYGSTAMGSSNAGGFYSTASGYVASASGDYSTASGHAAKASGDHSTALGPYAEASGDLSTALGFSATARGNSSTALGNSATAGQSNSVAIGYYANCNAQNSMVLSGYRDVYSGTPYELVTGFKNYRFWTKADFSTYVMLSEGAGSWTGVSDSTKKERFLRVDGEDVLRKISKFNLTSWNFKKGTERHYGPMAQDFYAAFGRDELGTIGTDTTINSGDFDGVNFIAIQALEKRTQALQRSNDEYRTQNNQLIAEVESLRRSISEFRKNQEELMENFRQLQAALPTRKEPEISTHKRDEE